METKRSRNIYSLQLFLAAFLLVLVLDEPSSRFRAAAMQASAEHVRCSGSMVECSDQMAEEELSMESETSRRFVQAVRHISPGVLRADSPVCGNGRRAHVLPHAVAALSPEPTPGAQHFLHQNSGNSHLISSIHSVSPPLRRSQRHHPPPLTWHDYICSHLGDKVALTTNGCNGSIAECNEEYELLMPTHISERYLEETKKYISPGTLKPDQPVCNGGASGQSYSSSCLPPPSNPPSRGCSKYYRCRSDD
ncbi:hypothetical protein SADUNF_Sadunf16G0199100 [Salix dunnii]|uniref:Uncharacterized protein n=1 Tax=Salix dunnii TaxID=1413687 RepID=A0A835J7Q8_9ROSI|nr:hypothetical protein SADUNF_Sadunf16G0199100 [Salix dunnii]